MDGALYFFLCHIFLGRQGIKLPCVAFNSLDQWMKLLLILFLFSNPRTTGIQSSSISTSRCSAPSITKGCHAAQPFLPPCVYFCNKTRRHNLKTLKSCICILLKYSVHETWQLHTKPTLSYLGGPDRFFCLRHQNTLSHPANLKASLSLLLPEITIAEQNWCFPTFPVPSALTGGCFQENLDLIFTIDFFFFYKTAQPLDVYV